MFTLLKYAKDADKSSRDPSEWAELLKHVKGQVKTEAPLTVPATTKTTVPVHPEITNTNLVSFLKSGNLQLDPQFDTAKTFSAPKPSSAFLNALSQPGEQLRAGFRSLTDTAQKAYNPYVRQQVKLPEFSLHDKIKTYEAQTPLERLVNPATTTAKLNPAENKLFEVASYAIPQDKQVSLLKDQVLPELINENPSVTGNIAANIVSAGAKAAPGLGRLASVLRIPGAYTTAVNMGLEVPDIVRQGKDYFTQTGDMMTVKNPLTAANTALQAAARPLGVLGNARLAENEIFGRIPDMVQAMIHSRQIPFLHY